MKATESDLAAICDALPSTEFEPGEHPGWKVPTAPRGKTFLKYREPRKDAIDPATGERYDDLLVVWVPDEAAKAALVGDPALPFFATAHFDGYNAGLVKFSRLGEIARDQLVEIITEAWAARAPKRLVAEYFARDRSVHS